MLSRPAGADFRRRPGDRLAGPVEHIPVRRLGTAILERVVPASVNGTAEYEITPLDVRYRLTFSVDRKKIQ